MKVVVRKHSIEGTIRRTVGPFLLRVFDFWNFLPQSDMYSNF